MNQNISHRNHYIPQFYLKNWSPDGRTIQTYSILVSNENVPYWTNIEKIIFYYYSERDAERGIPVRQKVEYKSVQELWKQLKALPSQYNCNYSIPQSDEVEKLFEIFNLMSGDKSSNDAIIKSVNSVPRFKLDELCKIAMTEMEVQKESGPPKDEKEQRRQFHEISRIALRNGILPSALYLYVTKTMKIN